MLIIIIINLLTVFHVKVLFLNQIMIHLLFQKTFQNILNTKKVKFKTFNFNFNNCIVYGYVLYSLFNTQFIILDISRYIMIYNSVSFTR